MNRFAPSATTKRVLDYLAARGPTGATLVEIDEACDLSVDLPHKVLLRLVRGGRACMRKWRGGALGPGIHCRYWHHDHGAVAQQYHPPELRPDVHAKLGAMARNGGMALARREQLTPVRVEVRTVRDAHGAVIYRGPVQIGPTHDAAAELRAGAEPIFSALRPGRYYSSGSAIERAYAQRVSS